MEALAVIARGASAHGPVDLTLALGVVPEQGTTGRGQLQDIGAVAGEAVVATHVAQCRLDGAIRGSGLVLPLNTEEGVVGHFQETTHQEIPVCCRRIQALINVWVYLA